MLSIFSEKKVTKAIKNPRQLYEGPEDVLRDKSLSRDQKLRVLKSWEEDTKALLRAEDENMPKLDKKRSPANLLQDIQEAEQTLHAS